MATYTEIDELLDLNEETGLRRRVAVATLVAADSIRQEVDDGTALVRQRKRYAQSIYKASFVSALYFRPDDSHLALANIFESVYRSVVIANISASKAQIQGASDSLIQTSVNTALDLLAPNFPDPVTP